MLNEIKQEVRDSITPHLLGIVEDAQEILRQEIELARSELKREAIRAKQSVMNLAVGAAFGLAAVLAVTTGVAQLLHELFPKLPLSGCYTIVAAACAGVGAFLYSNAKKKLANLHVIPQQAVETMKENVEWMKNRI